MRDSIIEFCVAISPFTIKEMTAALEIVEKNANTVQEFAEYLRKKRGIVDLVEEALEFCLKKTKLSECEGIIIKDRALQVDEAKLCQYLRNHFNTQSDTLLDIIDELIEKYGTENKETSFLVFLTEYYL